jgi:hypothetical protein
MKTDCCGKGFNNDDCPVKWNPHNGVIQCHYCGHVYSPISEAAYLAYKWDKERKEAPYALD